jgi:hypothetical protein
MNGNGPGRKELRRICGMLEEITSFANHASLTGALKGGSRHSIRQYNALTDYLRQTTALPSYLVIDVEEDAHLDEVGAAAQFLRGYLKKAAEEEEEEESGDDGEDDERRHRAHRRHGRRNRLADLEEVQELKEVGRLIRENLPGVLKVQVQARLDEAQARRDEAQSRRDEAQARRDEGRARRVEERARRDEGQARRDEERARVDAARSGDDRIYAVIEEGAANREAQARLERIGAELRDLAERLRREDLPVAERQEITNRISQLAQEQSGLDR